MAAVKEKTTKAAKAVTKNISKGPKKTTTKTISKVSKKPATKDVPKVSKTSTTIISKPKTKQPVFEPDSKGRRYWLIKSEPFSRFDSETEYDAKFSILDLFHTNFEPWDGVRNHEANNNLINMAKNDICLFYHSNCKNPGIVGLAKVISAEPKPDKQQFDATSPYYDPKVTEVNPKWWCPDVSFISLLKRKLGLAELRESGKFDDLYLLKRGRLSVTPVSSHHFTELMKLQNDGRLVHDRNTEFDIWVDDEMLDCYEHLLEFL